MYSARPVQAGTLANMPPVLTCIGAGAPAVAEDEIEVAVAIHVAQRQAERSPTGPVQSGVLANVPPELR